MYLSLSEMRASKQPLQANGRGVYFLFNGEEVVYVGCGVNILRRIAEHSFTKTFDSWAWLPLPSVTLVDLRAVEAAYILALKPRLNGNGKGHLGLSICPTRLQPALVAAVSRAVAA